MSLNTDYFRNLLSSETKAFDILCQNWCLLLTDTNIPEDVIGQIRSTIGQTNLLMNQRFKQFNGLIDDCEFKRGQRETKIEDLLGFWEMIYYQIEDVKNKFNELDKLKANGWLSAPMDLISDEPIKKITKKHLVKVKDNNNSVKENVTNNQTVRKALSRKN